jgi:hypothetical protein
VAAFAHERKIPLAWQHIVTDITFVFIQLGLGTGMMSLSTPKFDYALQSDCMQSVSVTASAPSPGCLGASSVLGLQVPTINSDEVCQAYLRVCPHR